MHCSRPPEPPSAPARLTAGRKAIYSVITVVGLALLAELILRVGGVQALADTEDPYVGFARRLPLFVPKHDANGKAVMETAPNKRGFFNRQTFAQEKPANGYRIFCLGGSTTYGHPYTAETSFCGWLQVFLNKADPTRSWEVINAGGISYASYRVTALMEELVRYQPDLFIVYSGHNEFIEERTYREIRQLPRPIAELNAVLGHSRVFTAVRNVVQSAMPPPDERFIMAPEVDERLANSIGPVHYHRDEALRAGIVEHYRFNLSRMVSLARKAGSDIMFVTPAVNLKDMAPFKSEHREGLTGEALQQWEERFAQVRATEDMEQKRALAEKLVAADPKHAAAHYEHGKALFSLGRFAEAREAYVRALDEDILPLRVLPVMVEDLRAVARNEDVSLIDFTAMIDAIYRRDYGHEIPGSEYFIDHVHLTVEGYRLLGLELLRRLTEMGVARPGADWGATGIAAVTRDVLGAIDAKDHGNAIMTVAIVLGWAGMLEESHRLLLQAQEILGEDPKVLLRLARSAERRNRPDEAARFHERASIPYRAQLAEGFAAKGDWTQAEPYYRDLVDSYPREVLHRLNLAIALDNLGREEEAMRHFEEARRLDPGRPEPYVGLAGLYERRGNLAQARDLYRKAVANAPDDALARTSLGINLAQEGFLDEAIVHFEEAVRIDPDSADAHFNLAQALLKQHRESEAEEHLHKARSLAAGTR